MPTIVPSLMCTLGAPVAETDSFSGFTTLGLDAPAWTDQPAPSPWEHGSALQQANYSRALPQINEAFKADGAADNSTPPSGSPSGLATITPWDDVANPASVPPGGRSPFGGMTLPGGPMTASYAGPGGLQFSSGVSAAEHWLNARALNKLGNLAATQIDEELFTYTGSDLKVIITPASAPATATPSRQLLEISTLTISVHREKAPVRALGYINPKGFARGKRTIAGTLVLTQFTVDTLYRFLYGGYDGSDLSRDSHYVKSDQLPPFNATLIFADEYGHQSYRRLLGVDILTSGEIYSVNDMITEQTLSYMASDFTPLVPADTPVTSAGASNPAPEFSGSKSVFDARSVSPLTNQ